LLTDLVGLDMVFKTKKKLLLKGWDFKEGHRDHSFYIVSKVVINTFTLEFGDGVVKGCNHEFDEKLRYFESLLVEGVCEL
jgi:hypothetical protein